MKFPYAILSLLLFISCSDDDVNGQELNSGRLECIPQEVAFAASGGVTDVAVTCNGGEWNAYADAGGKGWISVKVTGSIENKGKLQITVDENQSHKTRLGNVVVKSGFQKTLVAVRQAAPLQLSAQSWYSCSRGETVELTVSASSDWEVSTPAHWIEVKKKDASTLQLLTQPNPQPKKRTAEVTVTAGDEQKVLMVVQESAEDVDINIPEGYRLVWHDEFNEGDRLGNDWIHEVQPAGWVNHELQNYVDGSASGKRVTELVDGKLSITCFRGNDGKVYSGRIYAKKNTGWKYGYFEARILLPKGKGTWPAFWMMPVNHDWNTNPWPMCGEIDIMEEVGAVPNEVSSSLHTQDYNHTLGTQKTNAMVIDEAEGEFHVYALEWTAEGITTYVDGKVQLSVTRQQMGSEHNQWPFHYAFYPILNLAWGGDWGGINGVDESALPVTMKVDYIRIFQQK